MLDNEGSTLHGIGMWLLEMANKIHDLDHYVFDTAPPQCGYRKCETQHCVLLGLQLLAFVCQANVHIVFFVTITCMLIIRHKAHGTNQLLIHCWLVAERKRR